ncbi:MAG: hypothetical protein Q7S23_00840 [bacterium]|nr:hypothetical protein [bacterium]
MATDSVYLIAKRKNDMTLGGGARAAPGGEVPFNNAGAEIR